MKLLLLNHIQNAHDSLRNNRLRTLLTILGVAIGIASIVTIMALGEGAGKIVSIQVDSLGGNIAVVRPQAPADQSVNGIVNQTHAAFTASTLTETDVTRIEGIANVQAVAPLMLLSGTITGTEPAPAGSVAVATTPELIDINNVTLQAGQMFNERTSDHTAVIGVQLSIDMFGTEGSIGKTFTLRGDTFRVIGVLDRMNTPVNYNGVNFDSAALIPFEAGAALSQQNVQIQQINVQSDSVSNLERVIIDINKALASEHRGEQDFAVLSGDDIAQPTSQLFFAITGMVATIAGISLLVGGVGIMNIMLVNVAERTREIGIRKAVGATRNDIVWQFLIESLVMGIVGGVIGVLFGYGFAFVISLFLTFDPSLSWQTPLIALGVAAFVGVVFGLYPAARAARKDPIESLRQYN